MLSSRGVPWCAALTSLHTQQDRPVAATLPTSDDASPCFGPPTNSHHAWHACEARTQRLPPGCPTQTTVHAFVRYIRSRGWHGSLSGRQRVPVQGGDRSRFTGPCTAPPCIPSQVLHAVNARQHKHASINTRRRNAGPENPVKMSCNARRPAVAAKGMQLCFGLATRHVSACLEERASNGCCCIHAANLDSPSPEQLLH